MRLSPLAGLGALLWGIALAAPAMGQPAGTDPAVVVSTAPEDVAVTLYRDPQRRGGGAINPRFPGGFAVISETRTIALPAGPATIRFAGVAEGMVAVSAVIKGLPGGVIEQNRDKKLLSPGALVDGTLGNRVTLIRTDPATGESRSVEAIVRSSAQGALVLETEAGFEALRCSGLPERLRFTSVPDGLFSSPVLSVDTVSPAATTATVTLTYLAAGFDWNADYVARLSPDGQTLDLSAWLTLANSNSETLNDAEVLAIAGTVNTRGRIANQADRPQAQPLALQCWPQGSTAEGNWDVYYDGIPPPPPAPPPPAMAPVAERALMVSAGKSFEAELEALGDLKLYRVPFRSTVAARGQKQVALLSKQKVPYRLVHRADALMAANAGPQGLSIEMRLDNRRGGPLGLPLPAGSIRLYDEGADRTLLRGSGRLNDAAVGETVKVTIAQSPSVMLESTRTARDAKTGWERYALRLSNAGALPIDAEIGLGPVAGYQLRGANKAIKTIDGERRWVVTVQAGSDARLEVELRDPARNR